MYSMMRLYIISIKSKQFWAISTSNYLKYNMFLVCFFNENKLFH